MSGDLVERLRVRRGAQGHPMGGHDGWCDLTDPEKLEAADEIERLRAAGDALAEARSRQVVVTPDPLLDAWEEARRG